MSSFLYMFLYVLAGKSLAVSVSDGVSFLGLCSNLHGLGLNVESCITETSIESSNNSCVSACDLLGQIFPDLVSTFKSPSYRQQQSGYWSNQQENTFPVCRIQPRIANHIAATLLVNDFFNCPFAVKSGGHSAFAGSSNIQNGITVDLTQIDEVAVSSDGLTTRIGAGNRWIDVYKTLTPMNLSVIGGRVGAIGVGGLTLGGGISFFSGRHGWACDNVRNYELVLANASVVNVNQTTNPDLYFALRGGGNNFGIVTRFDLETFTQGHMWGGTTTYNLTANASIFNAFENFANKALQDPDAALITAFAYAQGQYFASNDYEYAKPIVNPPIFHEFTAIENLTSTMRISNITDLAQELDNLNPGGFRELYTTATFKNSAELQGKLLNIFVSEVDGMSNASGFTPALVMQPVTANMISSFSKNEGNSLGISAADGPLTLVNIAIRWSDSADDARIHAMATRFIECSVATAKDMKLHHKYIYQNYASSNQDVFASYGLKNKDRLTRISQETDPKRIFQRLQPGYFKLDDGTLYD